MFLHWSSIILLLLTTYSSSTPGSPAKSQWSRKGLNSVKTEMDDKNITCHLGGRLYLHGDHIDHHNPCENCMCFRGDVLCWGVECPPMAKSPECREVTLPDRCCPVYACPETGRMFAEPSPTSWKKTTHLNQPKSKKDCHLAGSYYPPGEVISSATGPCLECRCGEEGSVVCSPKECSRQPQKQTEIPTPGDEMQAEKPIVNIHQPRHNDVNGRRRRQFL